jgi:hypothetical protein
VSFWLPWCVLLFAGLFKVGILEIAKDVGASSAFALFWGGPYTKREIPTVSRNSTQMFK